MASVTDAIYRRSPTWLQNLGVSAWGSWWFHRRFGGPFSEYVRDIGTRDRWTSDCWQAYQANELSKLFMTARSSPDYREVFTSAGVRPGDAPFAALAKLPLLSKQTLRTRATELLTRKPERGVEVFRSSGTTGTPTDIYMSREFHRGTQAFFEARNRNWAGVTYRDRRAMFGVRKVCRHDQMKPPFWRTSPVENLAYFSIYHLSPRFMGAYADFLWAYRPRVVMGYPNSLATLARWALDTGNKLPAAKAVITTRETVTEEIRRTVEAAFGCRISDQYCAVEACMLATQCEHGRHHISPDFWCLRDPRLAGQPCLPGVIGRGVYTELRNTLQPLIRYDIGDAVAWSGKDACPCGRHMPMIQSIEGRVEDTCYTVDGRAVLRFDTVFKGIRSIREAQVVQEEIDRFVIHVVPTLEFDAHDAQRLVDNMAIHGGRVHTEVRLVEEIARTPAGKYPPVISKVASESLTR